MRSYSEVKGDGGSGIVAQVTENAAMLERRLGSVGKIFAVASGKGGVGKSSVTTFLASVLARKGHSVGVLDIDINGSSIPHAFGVENEKPVRGETGYKPVVCESGIKIMSLDFFQGANGGHVSWDGPSSTSAWLGSMEVNAIRELLADTEWCELDYLILDMPPVLSRLNDLQGLLPELDGVVVVTTPSKISYQITLKTIAAVQKIGAPILGLVENMSGYHCVHCGGHNELFDNADMGDAVDYLAPSLGEIPFISALPSGVTLADANGAEGPITELLDGICDKVLLNLSKTTKERKSE